MSPSSAPHLGKFASRIAPVLLFLGPIVVFGDTCRYSFVNYDDRTYIARNPHVTDGLTAANVTWAFTTFRAANWHPLTWLSLQADGSLYRNKPFGYHLGNILWHCANTLLLYLLLLRMTGAAYPSTMVAALFALHPLHVESVAWAAERKDVLSTACLLLCLHAYIAYAHRRTLGDYLLVCTWLGLGLLAKPMLVSVPFLLLLLDYWPLRRFVQTVNVAIARKGPPRHQRHTGKPATAAPLWLCMEKLPLCGLVAISMVVTWFAQRQGGALIDVRLLPVQVRLENAALSYVRYIGKLFWPAGLAVYYPYPPEGELPTAAALSALLLLAISVLCFWVRKSRPYGFVGWYWYVVSLVPVIGLVQVGSQAMADRYTYVPAIGLFVALVWGIRDILMRASVPRVVPIGLGAAAVALCLALSCLQVAHWQDSVRLWQHALSVTNRNDLAHYNLGDALVEQDKLDQAADEFSMAIQIRPNHKQAHSNLGLILEKKGYPSAALDQYRQGLKADPQSPEIHFNMANLLKHMGITDQAEREYRQALMLNPNYGEAHNNLGQLLARQGRLDEAVEQFSDALRQSDNYMAHVNLGLALVQQGKFGEAAEHFQNARQLHADPFIEDNLGIALCLQGHWEQARRCFQVAVTQRPDVGAYYNDLAHALYQLGDRVGAVANYRQGLRLDPKWLTSTHRSAWALATSPEQRFRNGVLAVRFAQQLCEATAYQNPLYLDTLAAAYAENNRFTEAVELIQKALDMPRVKDLPYDDMLVRLHLYRSGTPYREQPRSSASHLMSTPLDKAS